MKLEWQLSTELPQVRCHDGWSGSDAVTCELPWDHIVLQNGEPARMTSHMGRSKSGTWYSWD